MIGPYTNYSFYYSPEGTLDPSLDSYQKQFERSGGFARWSSGSDGRGNWGGYRYPDGTCPGFASHDLGWIAASDIYLAKPLVNRFSLGINATSCPTCGPITLGTNFWLDLTYGVPSVDLKVNGSGGPVSVAGGSNITLTWDSVGYDKCYYGSSPAWYTPAWPTGKQSATTGSATTKIYYENVTYMINCKNSGSGTSATAQVTVNVTP